MGNYQEVFRRFEKKYILEDEQYRRLMSMLEQRIQLDHFGKTLISNIYLDTPDRRMIRASMEKPVYKEKLRLRGYGAVAAEDTVFIELKKKYKGIVYKRRVDMTLREAGEYLERRGPAPQGSQIIREIDWCFELYPSLVPSMYIGYKRSAYYDKENTDLRITFDQGIRWRSEKLRLEDGYWGQDLLAPGQRLMEIKVADAMPLWLTHALDTVGAFPGSFSKYGQGYTNEQASILSSKGRSYCA